MANRYWVGGTATWDATAGTKWATLSNGAGGAAVPTNTDDVFIDGSSGTGTITLADNSVCASLNCTGYTGTLSHPAAVALFIGGANAGASNVALKLVSGMVYTLGAGTTSTISFQTTQSTTQTVDSGGKTLGTVTFGTNTGSTVANYQLAAGLTTSTTGTLGLSRGTLDLNSQTVSWGLFSSNNSNTRTLTLGSSTITLTGAGTVWDMTTSTGATLNAGTSQITMNGTNQSPTFQGGGLTYYNITKVADGGGGLVVTAFGCNNFTYNGGSGNYTMSIGTAGFTVNGALTLSGNSAIGNRLWVKANTVGLQTTVALGASATYSLTNIDFSDTAFSGTGVPVTGTSLADGLGNNNSSITYTTSTTRYWVGGTGNWNDATHWGTSSGAAFPTSGSTVPTCQDTAVFDANSFTATGQTVTQNVIRCGPVDFGSVTNNPTLALSNPSGAGWVVFGAFTLSTGMVMSGSSSVSFNGRGDHTLTSSGATWPAGLTIAAYGGIYTLSSDLIVTSQIAVSNGTFNANGRNVTAASLASSSSNARTITMGSGTWTMTGNNATVWNTATVTNLVLNRGANPLTLSYSGGTGTRTITSGTLPEASAPSIAVTAGTDTISLQNSYNNVDFTGFAGAFTFNTRTIYGNLTLSTGMSLTDGVATTTFAATSGTKTITSNGKTMHAAITFDGVGGTWQLADNFAMNSGRQLTLTNGTFNANGKNVTTNNVSSSNTNVRSLTMGSGTWTLTGTGTVWSTGTSTNMTFDSGTSTLAITDTSVTGKTISRATGQALYDLTITGGTGLISFINASTSTVHNLTVTTPPANIRFNSPATYTFTGSFPSGTAGNLITIDTNNAGTAATLSKASGGDVMVDYVSLKDTAARGGVYWYAGANSIDATGNTGWMFTSGKPAYFGNLMAAIQ
jgi:hypothetical protein